MHDIATPLKRGQKRADGKVFWRKCGQIEYWFDEPEFIRRRQLLAKWNAEKYKNNRNDFLNRFKKYQKENKDKIAKRKAVHRIKNIDKIKRYYTINKYRINGLTNSRNKIKRLKNPIFSLKERCRRRINHILKYEFKNNLEQSQYIIGCAWDELKKHIESKFERGMNWENRNEWHIDHIIPLSSAFDEYGMKMLCHYTNLRPVFKYDNLKKSDKWNPPEYYI